MKSNFQSDLAKEKQLATLLDSFYKKHLKHYCFERISSLDQQLQGIDLVLMDKRTSTCHYVDEKAQLDYLNENLPTFAFELCYEKKGEKKQGWLFDEGKKTHFYALVTSIFSDEEDVFTSCNIMFVNRQKLIAHLHRLGLTAAYFDKITNDLKNVHGKIPLEKLHSKKEGYLYFSTKNKAERPINLVLKLEYLIEIGVGKRLV